MLAAIITCGIVKMILSVYAKQRILVYYWDGTKSSTALKKRLKDEDGLSYSRTAIWKFLREYAMHGSLARKEGSGRPTTITVMVKQLVERQMLHDDETTAYQLHK